MRKILVALDGSEHADHALTFAITLADKFFAELHLLTVVPPELTPPYVTTFHAVTYNECTDYSKYLEIRFRSVLSAAVEKVKKTNPTMKVSSQLERGDPADRIVETAKLGDFDIIIMGRRGLGCSQDVLGSVSFNVVNRAPCSVWTVE